jgi:hypothetical protein
MEKCHFIRAGRGVPGRPVPAPRPQSARPDGFRASARQIPSAADARLGGSHPRRGRRGERFSNPPNSDASRPLRTGSPRSTIQQVVVSRRARGRRGTMQNSDLHLSFLGRKPPCGSYSVLQPVLMRATLILSKLKVMQRQRTLVWPAPDDKVK